MCKHNNNVETSRRSVGRRSVGRNGSSVQICTGREGPRHDPYHYEEVTLTRSDGRWACVHMGLAKWMEYFDGQQTRHFEDPYAVLRSKFEAVMGVTPEVAARAVQAVQARRITLHPCGQRELEWVSGLPGESLLYCRKCGDVLDSAFNLSAIM